MIRVRLVNNIRYLPTSTETNEWPARLMVNLGFLGDGQNYHVQQWLPALSRAGLDVTLLTFRRPDNPLDDIQTIVLEPPVAPFRGRLSILDFWTAGKRVGDALKIHGIDVLMASYATHYGLAGVLSGFHPLIVQTWTFDVSTYPKQGWKRFIFGPQVRHVLKQADAITTDGAALGEYVQQTYPELASKTIPVRWGIDTDRIDAARSEPSFKSRYNIPEGAAVVVAGRGLQEVYRPLVVLDALEEIIRTDDSVYVVVLTLEHDRLPDVQSRLDRLSEHPHCTVIDRFLMRDEMSSLWLAADIVISVPVTDGISEGVLEAMYAGAIPIVSRIPSNASFIKEGVNGYFVQGDSEKELAVAVLSIVKRLASIKTEMAGANRDWVAGNASLSGTAAAVADLVRNLHESHQIINQ